MIHSIEWKRKVGILLVIVVVGSGAALLEGRPGRAFNPQPDPPGDIARLGLLTLTRGEVLRLYAVNLAFQDSNLTPQGRCKVRLGFSDIHGVAYGDPNDFELRPGVGAFVDLDAAAIGDPNTQPVRPEAFLFEDPSLRTCQIVVSAQVLDKETGAGSTYIGDPNAFPLRRSR